MPYDFAAVQQFTPLLITWLDAHGGNIGWTKASEVKQEQTVVKTVGLFHSTSATYVYLVSDLIPEEGAVNALLCIPLGMIQSVQPLVPV